MKMHTEVTLLYIKRLTGDQKVAGSISVWGSETFFWVCDKAWVANSFPSYMYILLWFSSYFFLTASQDEPTSSRVRRILHGGRSLGQARARRTTNQNFGNASSSTTPQFNASSATVRDTIDPIAELLSQLSGVRRSAQQSQQSVQSQLQLLQQQLQFERQQVQQTRERLERLPRRPMNSAVPSATPAAVSARQDNTPSTNSGFLLTR